MKERGTISISMSIGIVLLVAALVIGILFYISWNPKESLDKRVCHTSVILRGSAPVGTEIIKLTCKTEKVCITAKKGEECEKGATYDSVIKVKDEEELKKELIILMGECWWMMGEGKVDYRSKGFYSYTYCGICDLVTFDKSIQENIGISQINYRDLLESMEKTKLKDVDSESIPYKDESFLRYFFNVDSSQKVYDALVKAAEENGVTANLNNVYLTPSQKYVLVTAMMKTGSWGEVLGGGYLGGAIIAIPVILFGVLTGGIGIVGVAIIGGGTAIGGSIGWWYSEADRNYIQPMFLEESSKALGKDGLECEEWDILP